MAGFIWWLRWCCECMCEHDFGKITFHQQHACGPYNKLNLASHVIRRSFPSLCFAIPVCIFFSEFPSLVWSFYSKPTSKYKFTAGITDSCWQFQLSSHLTSKSQRCFFSPIKMKYWHDLISLCIVLSSIHCKFLMSYINNQNYKVSFLDMYKIVLH